MRTYKFRLYPSAEQQGLLIEQLNLCRELYNAMLQQRIYAYRSGKKVNYNSQQDELPEVRKGFPEYGNIHSLVIQDVAHRVDKAYDNFFRRIGERKRGRNLKAGFPRFKSRYSSITYIQSGFKITDNGQVWFSKIGEIRMFMHRSIVGQIKTLSIKRDSVGDWFITIVVEAPKKERPLQEMKVKQQVELINPIGTDLGLKSIITTSEGLQIEPPKYLRKSEKKLKRAQKQLSRKKKGSGKRIKAKKKVAKIHRKIERQRDDFSHKISRGLVVDHDLIAFEDLNINGMIRNHHIAKSIADAGWNKIVRYTMYKAESAGASVVLVDPRHTSQKCSGCGNIKLNLKLSDRIYHCNACGLTIDRDLNAAINVLNDGLIKVGRGTPEYTPVEIGALPEKATPVVETGSPLR
ncbi:MAG: transposase [Candidatus Thermoplasmatota archaeon]|nr:transposase [Candidatus Thermoplasmatota archaeon]MDA8142849.1 transposase [Thermoplasmatales archaeon]